MNETQIQSRAGRGPDRTMADWPRQQCKTVRQMRTGKYDGKRAKVVTRVICTKAIWGTADGEEYSERLILRSVKQLISFENQNVGSGWQ